MTRWGGWAPALPGPGLGVTIDSAALERVIPADAAVGERYPAQQMAVLDSERG